MLETPARRQVPTVLHTDPQYFIGIAKNQSDREVEKEQQ
jgi:hypothetical protein